MTTRTYRIVIAWAAVIGAGLIIAGLVWGDFHPRSPSCLRDRFADAERECAAGRLEFSPEHDR